MQAAQVYFPKSDYARLKDMAKKNNMSLASFIRMAALREERLQNKGISKKSFKQIRPIKVSHQNTNDTALNHDKYIY